MWLLMFALGLARLNHMFRVYLLSTTYHLVLILGDYPKRRGVEPKTFILDTHTLTAPQLRENCRIQAYLLSIQDKNCPPSSLTCLLPIHFKRVQIPYLRVLQN